MDWGWKEEKLKIRCYIVEYVLIIIGFVESYKKENFSSNACQEVDTVYFTGSVYCRPRCEG